MSRPITDELMWAISDAMGCARRRALLDDEVDYCTLHGDDWPCEEPHRIATALAPLIEARVREARAEALEDAARSIQINNWVDIFKGPMPERLGNSQRAVDWLRESAAAHRASSTRDAAGGQERLR